MGHILYILLLALVTLSGCAKEEPQPGSAALASPAAKEQQQTPGTRNIDRMQGTWQSLDDEASVVEIAGDQFISWYGDEKMATETLAFVSDCEEQTDDPDGEYFVVMAEGGALCYHVTYVADTILEYTYVARGNTLSYTKKK